MTEPVQEHPNDEPFRPVRVTLSPAAQKLDDHLAASIAHFTPLPSVNMTEGKTTVTAPAPGSFSASLKAMIDEAKAGLAQAQNDGRARVGAAVSKLTEAKVATAKVADGMASQIEDAAASALADLGQISNDI